jgi:hypothetical protein
MNDSNKIRSAILDRRQTGEDKEDLNPFNTAPNSEAEAIAADEIQRACMRFAAGLQVSRGWLTLQQLCDAEWARVHFEGELPPVHGVNHGVFFFSIDGQHGNGGGKFERCLLGDSLMIVSAANQAEASKLAQGGLLATVSAAHRYAFAAEMGVDLTQQNPGISVETSMPKRR